MPNKLERVIFVAGHQGMVGSAIFRGLKASGYQNVVVASRSELDLQNQAKVHEFFCSRKIDIVYLAAARVGGIHANSAYPADFIIENINIQSNVISAAHKCGVQHLLFLGSSCIYPKYAAQPIAEEALLTGALEPTNEPYAIAKIAGITMCESFRRQYGRDYRSVMPTNLYGPNDNFHPQNSHVVPALLARFHNAVAQGASEVEIWGSGSPMREFLHVDDMAAACIHVMETSREIYDEAVRGVSHLNVGTGKDCSIRELADAIAEIVGFSGKVRFNASKPDGAPRKLLDVSRIHRLGWRAKISLAEGLARMYEWYLENGQNLRMSK